MAHNVKWSQIISLKFCFLLFAVVFVISCYYFVWTEHCNTMDTFPCQPRIVTLDYKRTHEEFRVPAYASYHTFPEKQGHIYLNGETPSDIDHLSTSSDDTSTRNYSMCSSIPNVGPILRTVHITNKTRSISKCCTVYGDGLLRASVGKPAHITIKTCISQRNKLYHTFFFSVLAVAENHVFYATPSRVNLKSLKVEFTYVPRIPGQYDLFVEVISRHSQHQLPGSPFKLIVDGPPINKEMIIKKADQLPSCQTLPQTDLSWLEGEWVTREFAGEKRGTMRSGWVLQPNRCSIDIFTKDDLALAAASSTLKTILVLGRSTERGIFLSLVDILLRKDEKLNMKSSVVWKCWGCMEIRLGNLRFIYQDFRIEVASMKKVKDGEHVTITCHDEKKVSANNDFFGDAIGFFKETLFTEKFRSDVILLIVTNSLQLKLLTKVIPSSWTGSLYAMNGFKCNDGPLYTFDGRQADLAIAKEIVNFDKRFLALDGFGLATPLRHATQTTPGMMMSFHWHKYCSEQDGEIRVCGDATEMVAQILLGKALAPDGKDAWLASLEKCDLNESNSDRKIEICHDCPKKLMPWHIKRVPKLTCSTSPYIPWMNVADIQAWDGSLCPSECMTTAPVEKMDIQSGRVDVRICTVLKTDETNNNL